MDSSKVSIEMTQGELDQLGLSEEQKKRLELAKLTSDAKNGKVQLVMAKEQFDSLDAFSFYASGTGRINIPKERMEPFRGRKFKVDLWTIRSSAQLDALIRTGEIPAQPNLPFFLVVPKEEAGGRQ